MHEQQKRTVKIKPDYAHIETMRLLDENKRLRAALAEIANHEVALRYDVATPVQKIAEAALADQGKG